MDSRKDKIASPRLTCRDPEGRARLMRAHHAASRAAGQDHGSAQAPVGVQEVGK